MIANNLTPSSDHTRFLRVRYSDQIPCFGGDGFINETMLFADPGGHKRFESRIGWGDVTLRRALSTKATCWRYEQEWRYVERDGGRLYPYPGPLVEIVFGFRCPDADRERYKRLASEHLANDVRLYEMRRVRNSYLFERVSLGYCESTGPMVTGPLLAGCEETSIADKHRDLQVLMEMGRYSRALPLLEKAVANEPQSATLWRAKGVALGQAGRHEEALACFDEAIKLKANFFSAWYQRGVALSEMERWGEAIAAYQEAHKLNPRDASTDFNLACVLWASGMTDKAKGYFSLALKNGHPRAGDVLEEIESGHSGDGIK